MANIFNDDFQDFLKSLNEYNVEYILVGGYSVILHGYSRTTGDMDIWVKKTKENYLKIGKAFRRFGMPLFDMTESNFLSNPAFDVFTFGIAQKTAGISVGEVDGPNAALSAIGTGKAVERHVQDAFRSLFGVFFDFFFVILGPFLQTLQSFLFQGLGDVLFGFFRSGV